MFTFLNPVFLFALPAAAIPVLIHLLHRRKTRIESFSTLRFLKEMQPHEIKRLKIRQLILLIIRTLIIIFLITGFSRPSFKGYFSSGFSWNTRTSAVVILDDSFSMGYTGDYPVFDRAKERAEKVLNLFGSGDEIFAKKTSRRKLDDKTELLIPHGEVKDWLLASVPSTFSSDFSEEIQSAVQILKNSANFNREIYIITDLQRLNFSAPRDTSGIGDIENLTLFFVPVTSATDNFFVEDVQIDTRIIEPSSPLSLSALIGNSGDETGENLQVNLYISGKRIAQASASPDPHGQERVKFTILPPDTGLVYGFVELEKDNLIIDNRRYFNFFVPPAIKVLIAGTDLTGRFFIKTALNPAGSNYFRISEVELPSGKDWISGVYNVIILTGVTAEVIGDVEGISNFVKDGGGLLIFPGMDVDVSSYNRDFAARLGIPGIRGLKGSAQRGEGFYNFAKVNFNHPIFEDIFTAPERRIDSPRFFNILQLFPQIMGENIIELSSGDPFIVESSFGKGKIITVSDGLDLNISDFPVKGIFVPLIHRMVSYLSSFAEISKVFEVGDDVILRVNRGDPGREYYLVNPSGVEFSIPPSFKGGNVQLEIPDMGEPGNYILKQGKRAMGILSVNVSPKESELAFASPSEVENFFPSLRAVIIGEGEGIEEQVLKYRHGIELWRYFIAAAFLLLIAEVVIARGLPWRD